MLPLLAGGLALGGSMLNAQAEKDAARQRALESLGQSYAAGQYAAPMQDSGASGPSAMNMLAGAGLSGLDAADANAKAAKSGEEQDDIANGLRTFMRGRM